MQPAAVPPAGRNLAEVAPDALPHISTRANSSDRECRGSGATCRQRYTCGLSPGASKSGVRIERAGRSGHGHRALVPAGGRERDRRGTAVTRRGRRDSHVCGRNRNAGIGDGHGCRSRGDRVGCVSPISSSDGVRTGHETKRRGCVHSQGCGRGIARPQRHLFNRADRDPCGRKCNRSGERAGRCPGHRCRERDATTQGNRCRIGRNRRGVGWIPCEVTVTVTVVLVDAV